MNQALRFCPRALAHDNMKESIVAEEEESEDKETNQDEHENTVENLKKYVEEINRNGEEETDVVDDDFELGMSATDVDKGDGILRINGNDGKEEQKEIMIKEK